MTRIIADNLVPPDGFVTGPGPRPEDGPATRADALHTRPTRQTPHTPVRPGLISTSATGTSDVRRGAVIR